MERDRDRGRDSTEAETATATAIATHTAMCITCAESKSESPRESATMQKERLLSNHKNDKLITDARYNTSHPSSFCLPRGPGGIRSAICPYILFLNK